MATFKLSIKRGQRAQDVVRAAGSAIAGSDALEVNIDTTNMSKLEAILGLRYIIQQLSNKGFPQ